MFHTYVETSDKISKAYFPCNFVVIIQLILNIYKSGVEVRGASDDYLFFVFYVLINLTFSNLFWKYI